MSALMPLLDVNCPMAKEMGSLTCAQPGVSWRARVITVLLLVHLLLLGFSCAVRSEARSNFGLANNNSLESLSAESAAWRRTDGNLRIWIIYNALAIAFVRVQPLPPSPIRRIVAASLVTWTMIALSIELGTTLLIMANSPIHVYVPTDWRTSRILPLDLHWVLFTSLGIWLTAVLLVLGHKR